MRFQRRATATEQELRNERKPSLQKAESTKQEFRQNCFLKGVQETQMKSPCETEMGDLETSQ
eukprot:4733804-Amphidinium_carterae.1